MSNVYFVKNGGNDLLDGLTDDTAWETTNKVISFSDSPGFSPGDMICFKCGDTWNPVGNIGQFKSSGSPGIYITLTSYGAGSKPVINISSSDWYGLYIDDEEFIKTENILFSGGKTDLSLLWINNCRNIYIQNIEFSNAPSVYHGLYIAHGSSTAECFNIFVDNCTFDTIGTRSDSDAIRLEPVSMGSYMNNIIISDCTIKNLQGRGIRLYCLSSHVDSGNMARKITIQKNSISDTNSYGIDIASGSNFLLKDNILTNQGDGVLDNINGMQLNNLHDSVVEGNTVTNTRSGGSSDGFGIIIDFGFSNNSYCSENVVVRNNLVEDCLSTGAVVGPYVAGICSWKSINGTYYNNIIKNCSNGFQLSSVQSTGNRVFNNTIIDVIHANIWCRTSAQLYLLNNNIFSGGEYGIKVDVGSAVPLEDYNCFFNHSIANFYDTNLDLEREINTHSICGDPKLFDTYKIGSDSPCLDAGIDVGVREDCDGNERYMGKACDMGAYEYQGNADHQFIDGEWVAVGAVSRKDYSQPEQVTRSHRMNFP
ncbi:MAG TPA: right-handed parallel beta-helix repeat-containing protein [Candidatus Omnitrophota bacterium]|nr:right-handed parallel beta-helix repeat-containing protein [Candidatus Omnitrophota bacterium]